ncbi:hypothetical protein Tco_0844828 [Tanacetum coccineum]
MFKAAITPIETKLAFTKDEEAFDVDLDSKSTHLNAIKRNFKYLKGKPPTCRSMAQPQSILLKAQPMGFLLKPTEIFWIHRDSGFPQEVKIEDATPIADASGFISCQNEEILQIANIGYLQNGGWDQLGQPQPSAVPTPTHHVPTPSSSHVQITQPSPSLTQPVQPPPTITQSSLTPPQPSSVQPTFTTPPIQPVETTSSPPMFTIPDTQPTLPPSPQVPSPSYHDTEGPSFEPSYHLSPPPSHEPENQAFRSSEENEQLRNLMDIVPRLQSRVESLEKELSETKQTLGTAILQLTEKVKKLENKLRKKRKSKEAKDAEGQDQEVLFETDQGDTFATP